MLLSEGINEIIAVTKDNAAPIGIILRKNQCPKMILFKGSKTEQNIREFGWVTANFVSLASLYPKYAFSDVEADELVEAEFDALMDVERDIECDTERDNPICGMQRLRFADAWIGFTAKVVNETESNYLVDLTPVFEEVLHTGVRRVNRGFDAVIDATVHATRYVFNHSEDLAERIRYDFELIRKCGGDDEQDAKQILERVTGISLS